MSTAIASQSYTYDADGNFLSDGEKTYEWVTFNRLVALII